MKKFRGIIFICIILMFSTSVLANTTVQNIDNLDEIFREIKLQLIEDYGDIYKLNKFSYDYKVREEDNITYIDMNIYADMTLTRHPSDSPFIQGMKEALSTEKIEANKKAIQEEINLYVENIKMYYNKSNRSTFTYTIALDNSETVKASSIGGNYKLFYRNDTENETILIDVENLSEVEDSVVARENGFKAGQEVANREPEIRTLATFTYNRIAARDWARNNAFATPEYPSATVPGTDCANFVSKALRAGGIPQDTAGKWYGSSTWGGWSGDNWLRTGYYNNGGVVPYMTGKGYFYKQTNESKVFAGSIMYWNSTSHVALVTYGDGTTIMYTQHGAIQSKDTVYRTENASFYMPSTSIMP